jgi:alpha-amylase/alpha-mannosidase (GH57 family)
MAEVYVAFFWHQHQPCYKNVSTGMYMMPWLRLHAVKDYYGMAALLEECPEVKATINFVPSALMQLRDYVENNAQDFNLIATRKPAAELSDEDKVFILKNFFMANFDQMIAPYPRYVELYQKAGPSEADKRAATRRFAVKDWLDLQVWANLAWFHPISVERIPELKELIQKGFGFTEAEKQRVLALQLEVMRQVIPLHKKLQQRGQIEITTTPFYHPILPLLCDASSARQAMPGVALPKSWTKIPEDARAQLAKAVRYYEECFGAKPRGMWPSEGSVSQDVIPLFAEQGVRWIATDEEVLGHSIGVGIQRNPFGEVTNPEVLYKPYAVRADGKEVAMVFRDHVLSDLIGFQYQGQAPEGAAGDMIGRLERIADRSGGRRTLVSIILDGENAWEYYKNQGVDFLRTLYRRLAKHPRVRTTRIGDAVEQCKPLDRIERLFAGSWINHNFAIWIGHPEDNTAWDHVYAARKRLVEKTGGKTSSDPNIARAWEEIYAAEGSDWYWWYGDDHVTAQIEEFDDLFRTHLKTVYEAIGELPPSALDVPVTRVVTRRPYTEPRGFIYVEPEGRPTSYLEWADAGRCDLQVAGAMERSVQKFFTTLWFGFDPGEFCLRLDGKQPLRNQLPAPSSLRVTIAGPTAMAVLVTGLMEKSPTITLVRAGISVPCEGAACGLGQIFEFCVPFHSLGLAVGVPVEFYVELLSAGQVLERAPAGGSIRFEVPAPDFERILWQV